MLRGLGILPAWSEIAAIPEEAAEVLEGWLNSRWEPLSEAHRFRTIKALETIIQETSGRRLKSREVLADLLVP